MVAGASAPSSAMLSNTLDNLILLFILVEPDVPAGVHGLCKSLDSSLQAALVLFKLTVVGAVYEEIFQHLTVLLVENSHTFQGYVQVQLFLNRNFVVFTRRAIDAKHKRLSFPRGIPPVTAETFVVETLLRANVVCLDG